MQRGEVDISARHLTLGRIGARVIPPHLAIGGITPIQKLAMAA